MVQFQPRILLALCAAAWLLYLLSCRFDPRRLHGRLLTRCVGGVMLLCLWNLLLPLRLGVNPLSALIAGSLGIPGLGLLALLNLAA